MILRVVAFAVLGVALAALESALLASLGLTETSLHLGLGVILYLSAAAGPVEGTLGTAAVGYGYGLFASLPTALAIAVAVAVFLVFRLASSAIDTTGPMLTVVAGLGELAHGLLLLLFLGLGDGLGGVPLGTALMALAWQVVFAAVLGPAVYFLAAGVGRLAGVESPDNQEVWL